LSIFNPSSAVIPPTAAKSFFKGVCVLFFRLCEAKFSKKNTHALISFFLGGEAAYRALILKILFATTMPNSNKVMQKK
jgi:hypothetical protein